MKRAQLQIEGDAKIKSSMEACILRYLNAMPLHKAITRRALAAELGYALHYFECRVYLVPPEYSFKRPRSNAKFYANPKTVKLFKEGFYEQK